MAGLLSSGLNPRMTRPTSALFGIRAHPARWPAIADAGRHGRAHQMRFRPPRPLPALRNCGWRWEAQRSPRPPACRRSWRGTSNIPLRAIRKPAARKILSKPFGLGLFSSQAPSRGNNHRADMGRNLAALTSIHVPRSSPLRAKILDAAIGAGADERRGRSSPRANGVAGASDHRAWTSYRCRSRAVLYPRACYGRIRKPEFRHAPRDGKRPARDLCPR